MKLYGSWFSPFSRKISLALAHKGVETVFVDGLARENHAALRAVNPRGEVPTLVDADCVVVNSADILDYLDRVHPARPSYPADAKQRARARALERLSDTRVDAILVNCSYWNWAQRSDQPPEGLLAAGQEDLDSAFAEIETTLAARATPYAFGAEPGVVEFSLWPHLAALRALSFTLDEARFPETHAWFMKLRSEPLFRDDLATVRAFLPSFTSDSHETRRIFWRGDRIEWMLAHGFQDWFFEEIRADRVLWP